MPGSRPQTVIAGVVAVALLGLPACATSAAPEAAGGSPATTTGSAAPTALKSIDTAALQAALDRGAAALTVPGAVVVIRTPQGEFHAVTGTAELGTRTPPDPGMHFRIASNTKTLTGALIMLLAQDGALSLDDPVSRYVPEVPHGDNITVAQLLSMRSGLYNYTSDPHLATQLDADPAAVRTPQQMLEIVVGHPSEFSPGAAYEYNNTNFLLLGLIAERVGGAPLAQQFGRRLFTPVGLSQTSLPSPEDTALPAPFSHGYMFGGSRFALADDPYPTALADAARAGTVAPTDYTHQNPSYATAAGGAISTADDLATWIRALVSGEVFDADTQQRWLASPQAEDPADPDGKKYGYGIAYQRFGPHAAMYYHGGEMPGFNALMGHDPDNDVTLVIWTNSTLSPDGQTTANALLPAMLDEIYAGLDLAPATPTPPTTTTR